MTANQFQRQHKPPTHPTVHERNTVSGSTACVLTCFWPPLLRVTMNTGGKRNVSYG